MNDSPLTNRPAPASEHEVAEAMTGQPNLHHSPEDGGRGIRSTRIPTMGQRNGVEHEQEHGGARRAPPTPSPARFSHV